MYQPVMGYPDEALAAMVVGEETVAPDAGEDSVTVTPADATALVSIDSTNSEKQRLSFPSWSFMGLRVAAECKFPDSTLSLTHSRK
jgi:hypothetical protein